MVAKILQPFSSGIGIGNVQLPKEGPKAVPFQADFSIAAQYAIDLQYLFAQTLMSMVQVVWVDNSANAAEVSLFVSATQQTINVPANFQGYFPILSPTQGQMLVTGSVGHVVLILINVPMSSLGGWSPSAAPSPHFLFDVAGNLKTADQGLAPIIDPVLGLLTRSSGGGGGGTLDSVYLGSNVSTVNEKQIIAWTAADFTLTITGLRVVMLGDCAPGGGAGIDDMQIYTKNGVVLKTTLASLSFYVPAAAPLQDRILMEDYSLQLPCDASSDNLNFTVHFATGGTGVTVDAWGHFTPVA